MGDIVIGIDLGTTNSCGAYYFNGRVRILENDEGGRITPSYVFITEKNATVVGHYARRLADAKPECGIYEIKRLVGRKFDDPYIKNNLQYFPFKIDDECNDPVIIIEHQKKIIRKTPQELSACILAKIKKDVERKLGQPIDKAVITVPAYFNITQREVTLAAANQAGFTVLKLLNEPTAAALSYYLENDCETENHSLVYDLGGGTFDVAILKRTSNNIDIICVDGDTSLGGHDFDNVIIDYICDQLITKYKYNPKSERRTMRRLHNECEEAKKTLSVTQETTIVLNGFVKNHGTIEIDLTRQQFEGMIDKLLKRTIEIVDNCLKSANVSKTALKEVILFGGSTRIPKIQEMISSYFDGKNLNRFVNPDECVAEGAALQAAMLSSNPKQQIDEIQITDVTPLSLGICNFVDLMTFFIKRNTPIPASQTLTRVTVENEQDSMSFNVYEGERLNSKKNHCLGTMVIHGLTPAPPAQCEVNFTMTIDENGILTVKAKEKLRDNVRDLKIVYTRGHRSDSEVKNALKDADDNKHEDERFRKFAYSKEYLLDYCERTKYNLKKKNLIKLHKKIYELCKATRALGEGLHLDDEVQLNELIEQIKLNCEDLAEKYKFELMPMLRS